MLARFLLRGHYHGIDVNASLIRAALVHELLLAGLQDRVPAENPRVTDRFECDFGVRFDFAIAQSVFTHLPLNHIRLCLYQLSRTLTGGGRFYATFFEPPAGTPFDRKVRQPRQLAGARPLPLPPRRPGLGRPLGRGLGRAVHRRVGARAAASA